MHSLQIPIILRCDNNSIFEGEEALLMLLYWFSMPRLLCNAQEFFQREYSQLSRIIKATIQYLMEHWRHLVDNNLNFSQIDFVLFLMQRLGEKASLNLE